MAARGVGWVKWPGWVGGWVGEWMSQAGESGGWTIR